jgi:hypothetical protein
VERSANLVSAALAVCLWLEGTRGTGVSLGAKVRIQAHFNTCSVFRGARTKRVNAPGLHHLVLGYGGSLPEVPAIKFRARVPGRQGRDLGLRGHVA